MPRQRWWSPLPAVVSLVVAAHELPELQHRMSVTACDSVLYLGVPFVQELTLLLDSLYALQARLDYQLDARHGIVRLTPFFRRLFRYRDTVWLWISARYVPLFIQPRGAEQMAIPLALGPGPSGAGGADSGVNVQAEGRFVRGFTVQKGSGLILQSGIEANFRAQLAGQAEFGGRIVAEQMPITGEGATLPLTESEQVALSVRSGTFQAEVGQLAVPLSVRGSTGVERVTGIEAAAQLGGWKLDMLLGHAAARTVTVRIQPIDGVPGPYRLRRGEAVGALVPGSERVWVDGVLQERGEDRDYVIDYWRGELTFRPRRPLSAASQIVVEYALMEEGRLQTLFCLRLQGAPTTTQFWSAGYVQSFITPLYEIAWDGKPMVRDGSGYAVLDGATWVGVDSLSGRGRGWYRRRDTLDGAVPVSVWQYAPGAPEATYMVEFSYVGQGRGAYEPLGFGAFRYVGQGKGSYAPLRFVPLPSQRQHWELSWGWKSGGGWQTELSGQLDRLQPYRRHAEWLSGGGVSLRALYTVQPDTARSPVVWESALRWRAAAWADRTTAELEHRAFAWQMPPSAEQSATERVTLEQRLRLRGGPLYGEAMLGWQRYAGLLTAVRWATLVEVVPAESTRTSVVYSGGRVVGQEGDPGLWHRLTLMGLAHTGVWLWRGELRLNWGGYAVEDSPQWVEGQLMGQWAPMPSMAVELHLPWRWQREPWPGSWWGQPAVWLRWTRAEQSAHLRAGWNILGQGRSSRGGFPLLLWQGNWRMGSQGMLQWLYEASGGLSGTLVPVFLRVLPGQGGYRYRGDLNGNGSPDASEFEPVPVGGEYVMVPMRAEDRLGTGIRAEASWSWAVATAVWSQAEWQGRLSLVQRGRLRAPWWSAALPRRTGDTTVMTTQWMAEQQLRLYGTSWEGALRGEWSGLVLWLGTGWERRNRASGEAQFQTPIAPLLRFLGNAGPVWEEIRSFSGPGQHVSVRALRAGVGVTWQMRQLTLAPQLRLLYGWIAEQRAAELTNLSGGLSLSGQLLDRWRIAIVLRSGLVRPAVVHGMWLLSSLEAGTSLSGSFQYEAGSTVWVFQYQAVRAPGYPWWYTLSGQVQVRL